ncbi:single-stranded DNA-binding protein [Kitasatospora sp. RB6PN24]|uniref:single-stranded DNA-binding protein n=1 Tax=Kitasatospora humi TaxID=2893891 RepID=UPI001E3006D6|nr:single-stranded DNA-binding protein [Kitasatospora humi]MCC9309923.1 single-stranded DNA-binding protein [Kitasatospora humi]
MPESTALLSLAPVPLSRFSPALASIRATITGRQGVEQHLALCVPAAPYGTAPWLLGTLALYLTQRRQTGEEASAEGLHAFFSTTGPLPSKVYRHSGRGMHDRRVTCDLDVTIEPRDESGWPVVSVLVSEGETGRAAHCSFNRVNHYWRIQEVLAAASTELDGEHGRLMDISRRRGMAADTREGLHHVAGIAGSIADRCKEALDHARQDVQRQGAAKARQAMHRAVTVEDGFPEESPMEVLTGELALDVDLRRGDDGTPVARLQLDVDRPGAGREAPVLPELLVCSVKGPAAPRLGAALRKGSRVVIRGRRRYHRYAGGARSAVSLDVESIGLDLMAEASSATSE